MALQEEFEKQGIWLFKYRSNLPIIILVLGYALYCYKELNPEAYFLQGEQLWFDPYFEMICFGVCALGLLIRVYTVGHTPKFTSGRNTDEQVAETLNTSGLYSTLRHPLYLGNFLMWWGLAMLTGNIWFNLSFILFCLFDISGAYLNGGTYRDGNLFFIYGTVLTGLSYVVLKFLKKKTQVLEQEGR